MRRIIPLSGKATSWFALRSHFQQSPAKEAHGCIEAVPGVGILCPSQFCAQGYCSCAHSPFYATTCELPIDTWLATERTGYLTRWPTSLIQQSHSHVHMCYRHSGEGELFVEIKHKFHMLYVPITRLCSMSLHEPLRWKALSRDWPPPLNSQRPILG